jgi:Mn2+/Fe2+ NRAMP family transporter
MGTYFICGSIDAAGTKFDDNRNIGWKLSWKAINLRIQPWVRRIITRLIIIPAVVVIIASLGKVWGKLLILSQVILSLQLVLPLFH